MTRTRHRSAWWCVAALALGAGAACKAPALRIDTYEPDASLYVDGRHVGHGAVELPFRYYGTTGITAVPVRRSLREDPRPPARVLVGIEPPAAQWLFPFDFLLEAVRRGFASAPPVDTLVELPTSPPPLPYGTRPPHLDELRARAVQVQQER